MAKLTEKQKAANKVARRARDQAFKVRRAEYEAAKQAAVAVVDNGPLAAERKAADDSFDAGLREANAEERRIEEQIRLLQAEKASVREKLGIAALADARTKSGDAYYRAKKNAEQAVDAAYPDVAGVFSAAEWEGKGGYTPQGEGASCPE